MTALSSKLIHAICGLWGGFASSVVRVEDDSISCMTFVEVESVRIGFRSVRGGVQWCVLTAPVTATAFVLASPDGRDFARSLNAPISVGAVTLFVETEAEMLDMVKAARPGASIAQLTEEFGQWRVYPVKVAADELPYQFGNEEIFRRRAFGGALRRRSVLPRFEEAQTIESMLADAR